MSAGALAVHLRRGAPIDATRSGESVRKYLLAQ